MSWITLNLIKVNIVSVSVELDKKGKLAKNGE